MPEKIKNEMLDTALVYLEKGISVIPVGRNKVPCLKWEDFQKRLATKEEVEKWWTQWPDANIGIVTGKISSLTVVDVEAGGDITRFPVTTTIQTGGGGWHLYYEYFPIQNMARVFPLTDVRGDGGYVVAPPSVHASGNKYKMLKKQDKMSAFPADLFGERKVTINKEFSKILNETIGEGSRNNSATSVCGKLLLRFKPVEWEEQAWPLFKAWNTTHNVPPLTDRELRVIFDSISQAEARRQSSGASVGEPVLLEQGEKYIISVPITDGFAVFEFEDVEYSTRSIDVVVRCSVEMPGTIPRYFSQRLNILSASSRATFSSQLSQSFSSTTKTGWPLILSQACELLESTLKKQAKEESYVETDETNTSYLLRPFLEEGVTNIIFGMGGSGKTYLSLGMSIAVSMGTPFLNSGARKEGNSLFIDYENTKDIWSSRITKMLNTLGVKDKSEAAKKMFYYNPQGVPIHDVKYQILDIITRRDIKLIIIDSAALATGGEPEKAETATRLFNALSRFKVTILLIAHETKDADTKENTPFGSVFFYNCARNIWHIRKEQDLGEPVIHAGLLHRKSNNESLSLPYACGIHFGNGIVDIRREDNKRWGDELPVKTRVLDMIRNGIKTTTAIAEELGEDINQVRARLHEMKNKGILVSPTEGTWDFPSAPSNDIF